MNSSTVISQLGVFIADFRQIQYYTTLLLLFPMGFCGSLISICVYSRRTFRNTAMGKYLIAQALSDMLLQVYTIWSSVLLDYQLLICQSLVSIFSISFTFNSLIKAVVSLDRMILVIFPFKFLFIKKGWFQLVLICIVTLMSIVPIVTLQFLTKYENIRLGVKSCYVIREPFSLFITFIYRNYDLYIGQLLPFITMLICGILILQKVSKMKAKTNAKTQNNKERILAIYTIFSISWYLLLSLVHICVLAYQIYLYDPFKHSEIYTFCLLFGLFLKNIEINSSVLIFLFFNRLYRSELLLIIIEVAKKLNVYNRKTDFGNRDVAYKLEAIKR